MANNSTQGKGKRNRFPVKHQHWCDWCQQWKPHIRKVGENEPQQGRPCPCGKDRQCDDCLKLKGANE
jgi:hypothetical protein